MTNRYVINGLITDMLDGKDILALSSPILLATHLVNAVEDELHRRDMTGWIETSSRRNGDRHLVLADLGSIRAVSSLSRTALRGRQADICVVSRSNLDFDRSMSLLDEMKAVVRPASGEIIPLD